MRADAPPLADDRCVDIDALGGQVLAEETVGQPAAQPCLPPVVVLPRIGVDGLVVAAVIGCSALLALLSADVRRVGLPTQPREPAPEPA